MKTILAIEREGVRVCAVANDVDVKTGARAAVFAVSDADGLLQWKPAAEGSTFDDASGPWVVRGGEWVRPKKGGSR